MAGQRAARERGRQALGRVRLSHAEEVLQEELHRLDAAERYAAHVAQPTLLTTP